MERLMISAVTSQSESGTAGAGGLLVAGVALASVTEAVASTILSLGRGDIIGDTYATPDELAWLDVGYTAFKFVGFIAAPWLIARFQLRSLVLAATMIMGAACGLAAISADLDLLVTLRAAQGFSGGILLVAGQTLLFFAYPRAHQPIIQAIFATGSVVAPATIAPALQGWLIDHHSWGWIFFANVPVAIGAAGLLILSDRPPVSTTAKPFDWLGFALLSATLACITYVCSQGSRWDWFEEPRIVWLSIGASMALLAFVARQRPTPRTGLLDLRAFLTDDFAFAFIVSFVAGAALFGSAYLIPSFAVAVLAFTPTVAGQLLLPSAGLFIGALLLAAFLLQARGLPPIAPVPLGILLTMMAMWMLSGSTSQSGPDDMMPAILLRGLGLGFLFLSITLIAFANLPRQTVASGISLFNIGRQLGGLLGVAALQTLIDHQAAGNRAVLAANVTSGMPAVAERLATTSAMLVDRGMEPAAASQVATTLLGRTVTEQSTVIAFDTAFAAVAVLFVIATPLLFAIKAVISRMRIARGRGSQRRRT